MRVWSRLFAWLPGCWRLCMWEFPKIGGTIFWGPYNKDLGYYIRVSYFRKLPCGSVSLVIPAGRKKRADCYSHWPARHSVVPAECSGQVQSSDLISVLVSQSGSSSGFILRCPKRFELRVMDRTTGLRFSTGCP